MEALEGLLPGARKHWGYLEGKIAGKATRVGLGWATTIQRQR